jgi:hypothetical protein
MAVIALTSASGSPGVTATALGLALGWPRPVLLVEADPTGGSGILAGFFRGTREYKSGLIELALAPMGVADALHEVAGPIEGSQASFIAGTRSHSQAGGLRDLWEPLAEALSDLDATGQDVIVDAGRLGLVGSPTPLLASADLTLLVTRTTLPALAAARSWIDTVRCGESDWQQAGLLVIGEGQPYSASEVTKVLGLPVVASLADDPGSAAVYHRGATPLRRFESSRLARSTVAAVESIRAYVARGRHELLEEVAR